MIVYYLNNYVARNIADQRTLQYCMLNNIENLIFGNRPKD